MQLDEFNLDLGQLDLGEIQKVEIGFATQQTISGKVGGLFGGQWHLTSVEVSVRSHQGGGALQWRSNTCS